MTVELFTIIGTVNAIGWMLDGLASTGTVPLQYGLEFYVESIFSTYYEVHSFQLGLYAGALVLVLTVRGYRRVASAFLVGLFVFAIGIPSGTFICDPAVAHCGGLDVQAKPWYFLTSLLGVGLLGPRLLLFSAGVSRRLGAHVPTDMLRRIATATLGTWLPTGGRIGDGLGRLRRHLSGSDDVTLPKPIETDLDRWERMHSNVDGGRAMSTLDAIGLSDVGQDASARHGDRRQGDDAD